MSFRVIVYSFFAWVVFIQVGVPAVMGIRRLVNDSIDAFLTNRGPLTSRVVISGGSVGGRITVNGVEIVMEDSCQPETREEHWPSGELRRRAEYCGERLHGKETQWYEDGGGVHLETQWHNNVRHGPERRYAHGSGQLVHETEWHFGQHHGTECEWSSSGVLLARIRTHFGQRHGETRYWSRDGTPRTENNFHFDQAHGVQREWNADGQLVHEWHMHFDQRHGMERKFNADGWTTTKWRFGSRVN